jgi:sugar lactone lactonase YvrE
VKRSLSALGGAVIVAIGAAACGGHGSTSPSALPYAGQSPGTLTALWVANGTNVVEFTPKQLAAGVSASAPQVSLSSPVFGAPQGVQFDAKGNLWVIDGGTIVAGGAIGPGVYAFTPSQLAALHTTPNPMPAVTIKWAGFKFPQQAVFDARAGNMWVTDNGANVVDVFNAAQLAAGGTNVTPYTTITSTTPFAGPLGIAFDTTGDLFVANNGTTTIFGFNAGTLPAGGGSATLTPSVVLSDNGNGSIRGPWGLAFDSGGNLWSSNANPPNTVVKFAKAYLTTTGSPMPAVTLASTTVNGNPTLVAPNGIAFDSLGDLAAISSATPFGVAFFQPSQLAAGGAVAPYAFVVGAGTTLNAPAGDTFGPAVY